MIKDTVLARRTVRRFTDEQISKEELNDLLMYASMAPSNGNAHPVEFIVVSDKEDLDYLSKIDKFGAKHIANVPQVILFIANKSLCKYWVQEASMTAAFFQLLAEDAGWNTGYIPFNENKTDDKEDAEDYVRKHFDIPDNYGVLAMVALGKKDERVRKRKEFPIDEKIHEGKF